MRGFPFTLYQTSKKQGFKSQTTNLQNTNQGVYLITIPTTKKQSACCSFKPTQGPDIEKRPKADTACQQSQHSHINSQPNVSRFVFDFCFPEASLCSSLLSRKKKKKPRKTKRTRLLLLFLDGPPRSPQPPLPPHPCPLAARLGPVASPTWVPAQAATWARSLAIEKGGRPTGGSGAPAFPGGWRRELRSSRRRHQEKQQERNCN